MVEDLHNTHRFNASFSLLDLESGQVQHLTERLRKGLVSEEELAPLVARGKSSCPTPGLFYVPETQTAGYVTAFGGRHTSRDPLSWASAIQAATEESAESLEMAYHKELKDGKLNGRFQHCNMGNVDSYGESGVNSSADSQACASLAHASLARASLACTSLAHTSLACASLAPPPSHTLGRPTPYRPRSSWFRRRWTFMSSAARTRTGPSSIAPYCCGPSASSPSRPRTVVALSVSTARGRCDRTSSQHTVHTSRPQSSHACGSFGGVSRRCCVPLTLASLQRAHSCYRRVQCAYRHIACTCIAPATTPATPWMRGATPGSRTRTLTGPT